MTKDTDAAAKLLAEWIGYSWDGIREERIVGYPQWSRNGIGSLHFQGGRQDLRDLAEKIVSAPRAVTSHHRSRNERLHRPDCA